MHLELQPSEWRMTVTCSKGHKMYPAKNLTYLCQQCKESVPYKKVAEARADLLGRDGEPVIKLGTSLWSR